MRNIRMGPNVYLGRKEKIVMKEIRLILPLKSSGCWANLRRGRVGLQVGLTTG